jgi:shikimate 5-dehydrogenase
LKRVLFGHRGVGKSSLLKRHQSYFPDIPHFDLDEEIANSFGQSIAEIFSGQGEAEFRKMEISLFSKISREPAFVIAVGGGFDVSIIPQVFERIYVSRRTDTEGRIFFNRPRLNPELDSLTEFMFRFDQRQPLFLKYCDWIYQMPEGVISNDIEKRVFQKGRTASSAFVSLQPTHLKLLDKFSKIELRTDLFSNEQILSLIRGENQFLISIRSEKGKSLLAELPSGIKVDWALECGTPNEYELRSLTWISSHSDSVSHGINLLEKFGNFEQKLCPIVKTWEELQNGYHWQRQDPERRSFLPRTDSVYGTTSVWRWFREFILPFQKLNFISQFAKIHDQPSLYEVYQREAAEKKIFSAVLGWPIEHSRTPALHSNYFEHSTLAIPLDELNFSGAMKFLVALGLKTAAVTSPLKMLASESTQIVGCNSLFFSKRWEGKNTDILAIELLCQDYLSSMDVVVVWGGGGIIQQMQEDYPQFLFFSSREGRQRNKVERAIAKEGPSVVMWGAPRAENTKMPPTEWAPRLVIDFNYSESSLGLQYALNLKNKTTYISGLELFRLQAAEQIKFFKSHLEKETPL